MRTIRHLQAEAGDVSGRDFWVVGTGTSLRDFDYEKLSGRLTIALNDAARFFEPWCLIHSDEALWTHYKGLALNSTRAVVCQPASVRHYLQDKKCAFRSKLYAFKRVHEPKIGRGDELLYCERTVATAAIYLAWKLGASRIFLLGVDGYRLGRKFYYADGTASRRHYEVIRKFVDGREVETRHERWNRNLRATQNALVKWYPGPWPGAGIYNLSELSTIDAFEKVEEVLALRETAVMQGEAS